MSRLMILVGLSLAFCQAASRLLVTVVDSRTGNPATGLKAEDFAVLDDTTPRRVELAEYSRGPVDVMLLLDSSLVGAAVQPVAEKLIAQLQPKEQMAIVSFHSAADLVQDFTSSPELLTRAVASLKYGNTPRVLDALYAAIDTGFQASTFRRVIILLTTGVEGPSRMGEREVVRLARRNGVSIYPVFVLSQEKSMFERLARQTGGACFELRDRQRLSDPVVGPRIFEVVRSCYMLTLTTDSALGERVRIEVKRPENLLVSGLPLD